MRRPPGSAHGACEWNNLRGASVGRFDTACIAAAGRSQPNGRSPAGKPNGQSPTGTLNATARKRQLAAIDAENKQLLWRMHTLRPTYSLSAIDEDYARRNARLESLRRGRPVPLCSACAVPAWCLCS